MKLYATYIGWQQDIDGAHFPLFNIHGDHILDGSTVDVNTLLREQIDVPPVPICPFYSPLRIGPSKMATVKFRRVPVKTT